MTSDSTHTPNVASVLVKVALLLVGICVLVLVAPTVFSILICGGFLVIGALAQEAGSMSALTVTFVVLGIILSIIVWAFGRYVSHRVKDPTLANTHDNTLTQNARYIQQSRAAGVSDEAIRHVFRNGGWDEQTTNDAFARANALTQPERTQ